MRPTSCEGRRGFAPILKVFQGDLKLACEISSFGFPLMGEKSCNQFLVKGERDLPSYLKWSKVEMSLLMTLFLVRWSKEMIVWTLASLVD